MRQAYNISFYYVRFFFFFSFSLSLFPCLLFTILLCSISRECRFFFCVIFYFLFTIQYLLCACPWSSIHKLPHQIKNMAKWQWKALKTTLIHPLATWIRYDMLIVYSSIDINMLVRNTVKRSNIIIKSHIYLLIHFWAL